MTIRTIRPNKNLIAKYFGWLALVLVFTLPWVLIGFAPGVGWPFVVFYLLAHMVVVAIAAILIPMYYRSLSYELTDEEVIVRKGIWTRTVQTVPYRTVTNVEVKRGPLDRMLGLASIDVHTAGYSQQTGSEAHLVGLADFESVEAELLAALRRYRARTGAAIGAEELPEAVTSPSGAGSAVLDEILSELRAIRRNLEEDRS
ncbi:MAG TPA: PH domain-containing protein [Chloroflexi bacterium]|nr:PH domain-containing protein [Chloroflexota bacterium]